MTPTYPIAAPTAAIRPKLVWVWVAVALMAFAFVSTLVLLVVNFGALLEDVDEMPRIGAGRSTVVDLDAGTYSVFVLWHSDPLSPDVSVIGDRGEVPVVQTAATEEYYIGNFHGRSNSGFSIQSPGSYEIFNGSAEQIAVGPSLAGRQTRAFLVPIGIGAVLGISGLVLLIVTLVRRRRAKSRLVDAFGAGPGVPYQGVPGQYRPAQFPAAPTRSGPATGGMPPPPPPSPGQWPQT